MGGNGKGQGDDSQWGMSSAPVPETVVLSMWTDCLTQVLELDDGAGSHDEETRASP